MKIFFSLPYSFAYVPCAVLCKLLHGAGWLALCALYLGYGLSTANATSLAGPTAISDAAPSAQNITKMAGTAKRAATGPAAAATDSGAAAVLSPTRGGRILFGSIGEATNLIPAITSDSASHEVASQLYVAPLRYSKDLDVETWAAASYEVLEGGRLMRFILREDIYWADGVQLTADDVAFTYRMMIDPKTPTAYAGDFLAISSFTQTGRFSFEVRYSKPFARSLSSWMQSIMPKHLLEGQDLLTTPFARNPVGAGPFRLKSWDSGNRIILAASDSYFEGRPYLDEVVYRIIPDLSTMFLELKSGRLDSMSLTPQQYLRQTSGPLWDKDWRKYRYLSFSYTYMAYNLNQAMFADVRVRQALTLAIDRQAIIDGVLLGLGRTSIGPFIPGTWAYNNAISPWPFDVEKAKTLLAEAGWKDTNGDGILDKDGKDFAFTILTNQGNDQRIKSAIIIQSSLRALGIRVRIRTVEWAAFIKEFVNKGRFDALILAWTVPQDPDTYDVWHSSRAKPGGLNFTQFKNAEVDSLLEQARATTDQDVRKRLYDRFQEILHVEQPYTFLYVPYALPIVQAKFHGIKAAPAGIMYNFERWWIPASLQHPQVTP